MHLSFSVFLSIDILLLKYHPTCSAHGNDPYYSISKHLHYVFLHLNLVIFNLKHKSCFLTSILVTNILIFCDPRRLNVSVLTSTLHLRTFTSQLNIDELTNVSPSICFSRTSHFHRTLPVTSILSTDFTAFESIIRTSLHEGYRFLISEVLHIILSLSKYIN